MKNLLIGVLCLLILALVAFAAHKGTMTYILPVALEKERKEYLAQQRLLTPPLSSLRKEVLGVSIPGTWSVYINRSTPLLSSDGELTENIAVRMSPEPIDLTSGQNRIDIIRADPSFVEAQIEGLRQALKEVDTSESESEIADEGSDQDADTVASLPAEVMVGTQSAYKLDSGNETLYYVLPSADTPESSAIIISVTSNGETAFERASKQIIEELDVGSL